MQRSKNWTTKNHDVGSIPGNIILIGMMGSGKTTVGKLLAKRIGKVFVDVDQEIQKRTGVRIPVIFEIEGEAGFRKREGEVLQGVVRLQNIVLATGGGAILHPDNRVLLRQHGAVVYLCAPVSELQRRTHLDKNRPLLQTGNLRAKLIELYTQRDPLYRQTAHIVVDSSRQGIRTLVQKLVQRLHQFSRESPALTAKSEDFPLAEKLE